MVVAFFADVFNISLFYFFPSLCSLILHVYLVSLISSSNIFEISKTVCLVKGIISFIHKSNGFCQRKKERKRNQVSNDVMFNR